ncbi:MAG: CPCC family cysteine-rich protein [Demequina sp.]|jgi:hypothetical protein|nr:CPCC family cysteine-rich protein [Demequina sp.]
MTRPQGTYPCPCCGYLTFVEPPGNYELCSICFWEDDAVQLRWPRWVGGANGPSLAQSQITYATFGAMQEEFVKKVRRPAPSEQVDVGWRPIDLLTDSFEPTGEERAPWPDDMTQLYWWRPTFWRSTKA